MQEHILILFYLLRSRELQVIYFQRRDQRNCLKTIFVGWLFVVLVVQVTPQLHHPCTRLSRPETGGDEQCHRGRGKGTKSCLALLDLGSGVGACVSANVSSVHQSICLTQTPQKHPLNPKRAFIPHKQPLNPTSTLQTAKIAFVPHKHPLNPTKSL